MDLKNYLRGIPIILLYSFFVTALLAALLL